MPQVSVRFEEPSHTVTEGSNVTVKVILSADPERTVTIPITRTNQGGATASDYSVPSNVVFSAGETSKDITFQATQDEVDDDGEGVKLGFGSTLPTRVTAGAPAETTVSITDDDVPLVSVSFEESSYSVAEGDDVTVKVKLSADPERTVTIPLTKTNQGGASNSDYSSVPQSVVFNSGDTEKTFSFSATDDSVDDDGESVQLGFGNLPARVSAGSTNETTVSITDDDVPQVTVSFEQTAYTVAEGSSETVKVKLSADPERTVEIQISATDMDGASPSDYSIVPQTVVFSSGETEKTFSFSATDDAQDDDGERVRLTFGTLPPRVSSASPSQAVVSIADDDDPSVEVSFEESSYAVGEGDTVNVKVVLSAEPERTVTVPITATGQGGASASDYSVPASVVFSAGDTEKEIAFQATQDTVDDDGESVKLGFGSSLPAGVAEGSTDGTTVSITDDDHPQVTVSFASASYTVAESDDSSTTNVAENEVTVTIRLSAGPERTVTIPLTASGQGGASASDYSVPASVDFSAGDTEKEITFRASPDAVDDDGESVRLGFGSSLPARITEGTPSETTVSITDDDVPSVTASFEQPSYTVTEGSSVAVKVTLSADPERTVTIPLLRVNQGGATTGDYSGVPQGVVFSSGDTQKTFDFEAIDDSTDDDGESVKVSFGTLPDQVSAGTNSGTTVSIADDDVPSVTVSFEEVSYTVAEGESVTVKVTLSVDPERAVTIPITKTNQGGATASDYSVPSSVVFNAGETEKTIDFEATDDAVDDDGESVRLGFGNLPARVSAGSTNETTVSITDDDVPSVTVSFEQSSYTVAEGSSETVKVVLSADPERTVTIPLTRTNQGGASNSDYSNVPNSVVFSSGETEKTFDFEATDDTADDDGEKVRLGFGSSLPERVTPGTPSETTVSITDDDVPSVTVSFEHSSYTVAEGSSETVKVKLSADPERTVEIQISATDMDGASSSDYSIVPQTVVFSSGETEKTFSFSATDDAQDDDGERVRLTFGNLPPRVSSASPSQAVVSIADDDDPSVEVSFEESSYAIGEGGTVAVKVVLSADPERMVTVPLTTSNQGGASASDYSVPSSVVFSAGDTEKEIAFQATQDTVDDDGESVRLGFGSSLPAGVTEGSTDETTVSITDDDHPQVTVSFASASYTVAESDDSSTTNVAENEVTVTIRLSADPERTVTIPLTASGQGGASASDYSVPASVDFSAGDTEKEITFRASPDAVDDDGESVRLGFGSSLPARITEGTPSETTVSITDDDVPSVTASFEQPSYTVAEGNSVTVKVKLSADPERTVTIPLLRVNQGGASSSDYSDVPAEIEFSSGDTEKTFTFTAASDSDNDDGESVRVSFGTLPDQVSAGTHSGTTVSITDDDVPSVTVSFEEASYTVGEGGSVAVKVKLSADPERTVTIAITKTNQGGASASDYSVPSSVVFSSGDTEKEFSFSATQDTVDDDGESVRLGFGSSLPTGVTEGSTDETTVSITDDDVPSVTVSFEETAYTVAEGNSVRVKVNLSADPERTVTIPLTKTNQGGASASDYSVPGSVVFGSGDTEKEFSFSATQDTVDDDGESVKLGFGGSLPSGVTEGSTDETTVSITDDDVPSVTVSFERTAYTVAEGNSVRVKVNLSADPERTVTIPLTRTNQGGATNSDYSSVPGNVVFNSGQTEKTFDFQATDDAIDDDGESVKLGLGNLQTGVSAGSRNESTVSITDNDTAGVTVSDASLDIDEGDSDTYTVVLDSKPTHSVTITVNDPSNTDVTADPADLTFTPTNWDTVQTVTVTAAQDSGHDDEDGTVTHTAASTDTKYDGISVGSVVVNVTDDEDVPVTVSFEQDTYSVIEGESATVTVTLSADPERTVTIPITATNQDDASPDDYSVPTSVVFSSGETEKTFDFAATDDDEDDNDESVKLTFGGLPTAVSEGTTNQTVVSIVDNDGGGEGDNKGVPIGDLTEVTVNFEQASYAVPEGDSVTVKVTLDQDPGRTVTIPLSKTDQGGVSSADHSPLPASVEFASGDTEKTFSFSATQDTTDDDGESVKVGFGDLPDGVTEGTTSETTISITDDDVPQVSVRFEEPSHTVTEGSSVTVKVILSADPERTVTIPVTATGQGGATASDYSVPSNVVFSAGETSKDITFQATQDDDDDDGEGVKLGFGSTLPTRVTAGAPAETTVSITDDDVPLVSVSFEESSYSVAEGDDVTVKVKLSADPERTVTIPLTRTNQGGASNSDYSSVPQSVVFNSGDTEKTFSFSATDDSADDDGESVQLGFGILPAGVSEGTINESTISITDNDETAQNQVSVQVSFQAAAYGLTEGRTTEVTVTLSADPERNVSIPLTTTNGTGTTSADYSGVPASVDFASGETQKSFIFTAEQDDIDEDAEEVTLGFDTLPDDVSAGTNAQAVVTIADSIHVSFGASHYEAYEGGVGAEVTVQLDSAPTQETVIPITATGTNGATSADWTGVPSSVTFAPGDTQESFILMAYDDAVEDDGESVELGFGTLPAGVARANPSVATVELMNMEVPTCQTAVWCATVEFADSGSRDWNRIGLGLGYHTTQEPYLRYSSLSDNRFTFRGKEYQVWSMFTTPGTHPDIGPGSPGRIPEYSTFSTHLMQVVRGQLRSGVDRDHLRDWTLYIDGIALPFTEIVGRTTGTFNWYHPKLQDLYAGWTDGDTYEVMIAEDPASERPEPPVAMPMSPRYLRVIPGDGSLVTVWKQPLKDGNSDITHYRLQWKLGTDRWDDPNAIEEATVQPPGGGYTEVFHMISGLTNYTLYTLRVIAVNGVGDGEPSADHFGMPQAESLDITDTVVNGNQLTITYGRTLDGSSIPSQESFRVLVNGGPRDVTGVSISGRSVILTLDEPAKRAIRASDEVEFRYVTPPSGAPAIRDTAGNYAYSCYFGEPPSEARNETDPGLLEPVRAEFTMVPASHGGPGSEVVFRIEFSEPVRVDMGRNYMHLLAVEGGTVTSAWWLDRDTTIWEIVLEPASGDAVMIVLPAGRACDEQGAPCGSGERRLSNQPEHTIPGPDSLLSTINSPASGAPGIEGSPQTGQTLTATTSGIDDQDGMSGAVFDYQWIRHDLGTATDEEIAGATGQTYTVTAQDEGMALKVRITFIDDAGNEESLTSLAVIIPQAQTRSPEPANAPATGAPGIQGTAEVGQTLTATAKGIADDDGMTGAVFAYQWLADDAAIDGATSSAYTVDVGDVGKELRVRVTFTDDAGNEESLISLAVIASQAQIRNAEPANVPATGAPGIEGTAEVGQTLTATTSGIADDDGISTAVFAYQWLADDAAIDGATSSAYTVDTGDVGRELRVRVTFTDDAGNEESLISLAVIASQAQIRNAEPANVPATGAPGIEGTAEVGQTLTATTSGIADDDGISTAVFAYQWLADDAAIDGATSSAYTVNTGDVGREFRVRVTFTDDAGNDESLTSEATGPVVAAPPPLTVSLENSPAGHNGTAAFTFDIRFSEHFKLSFKTLRDHAFLVDGGTVKKAKRQEKGSNIGWTITVEPESSAAVTVVLPATTNCGDSGAICTEDGRMLSGGLEFTVPGPGE